MLKLRFLLAAQLGMTVAQLMREMSALEETYWFALYRVDPWGPHRTDVGFAQIAQLLHNQNVKADKRRKLTDFLPWYRKRATVDEDVGDKIKSHFFMLRDRSDGR